jgi:hypothetical protein
VAPRSSKRYLVDHAGVVELYLQKRFAGWETSAEELAEVELELYLVFLVAQDDLLGE